MKRTICSIFSILLAGCLLPVLGYYGLSALQSGSIQAAAQHFLQDAQVKTTSGTAVPSPLPAAPQSGSPAAEEMVPVRDSSTQQILQVPLREYIIGAVASEMPYSWEDAALQAQAVAVHSYLLYCRDHNDTTALGGAWLSADPGRRQGFMTDAVLRSYWGTDYPARYARLSALVDEVLDYTVCFQGQPACTSYFAISNGRTEASQNVWSEALPYLQGVDSSPDKQAEQYAVTTTMTSIEMHSALTTKMGLKPDGYAPDQYFSNLIYTDAGYVYTLDVCGTHTLGTVVRSVLGLRSACFSIQWDGAQFVITTYGYGHGVGLSQTGAQAMAQAGSSWQDILQHYFPGTSIETS